MSDFLFWFIRPIAEFAGIFALFILVYGAFMLWLALLTVIEKFKGRK